MKIDAETLKKQVILHLPYVLFLLVFAKLGWRRTWPHWHSAIISKETDQAAHGKFLWAACFCFKIDVY